MTHPCSLSLASSFLNCFGAGSKRRRRTSWESSLALAIASWRRLDNIEADRGEEEEDEEEEEEEGE